MGTKTPPKTGSVPEKRKSSGGYKKVPVATTTSASDSSSSDASGSSRSPSPVIRQPSIQLPAQPISSSSESDIDERSDDERELFALVDDGDAEAVKLFLKANHHFDINKRDTEGFSVLHRAVINNSAEIVDILVLEREIVINDSYLHAIKENSMEMVLRLLKHYESAKSRKTMLKRLFPKNKTAVDASTFGEDMTPLLMAAMHGHYEMIELLFNRGERLGELHLPSCDCKECATASRDLKRSDHRINLLKGLSNPTYIAFMAGVDKEIDPVLRAFELVRKLKRCITEEPEYAEEYKEIFEGLTAFPVDLLSLCKDSSEAKIFLENNKGYSGYSVAFPYPRLLLALDLKQKEFVSHPHCQDLLYQAWTGKGWIGGGGLRIFKGILILISYLFPPILSIVLWFTICCCHQIRFVQYLTTPKNRFRTHVGSYVYFLTVLCAMNSMSKGSVQGGPPSYFLPWIVSFYVVSQFCSFVSHFLLNPKYFLRSGWNFFELINHILFFITLGLWMYLWTAQQHRLTTVPTFGGHHVWDRKELSATDPLLLSEIALAFASTMAGLRILRFFVLSEKIGPLQVALGKMTKDILLFLYFFLVVIISFAIGEQYLYRPYAQFNVTHQDKTLTEISSAIEAFFWATFTMTDADSSDLADTVVAGNFTNHHHFTEIGGKGVFIAYHIITVSFLMTLLTGVMAATYGKLKERVESRWRFARARIWVHFMEDSVIPPPFNVLPNGYFINAVLCNKEKKHKVRCSPGYCFYADFDESEQERKRRQNEFPRLIRKLLQRYFRSQSSTLSEDTPTKGDVMTVQNIIVELKEMTKITLDSPQLTRQPSPTNLSTQPSGKPQGGGGIAGNIPSQDNIESPGKASTPANKPLSPTTTLNAVNTGSGNPTSINSPWSGIVGTTPAKVSPLLISKSGSGLLQGTTASIPQGTGKSSPLKNTSSTTQI